MLTRHAPNQSHKKARAWLFDVDIINLLILCHMPSLKICAYAFGPWESVVFFPLRLGSAAFSLPQNPLHAHTPPSRSRGVLTVLQAPPLTCFTSRFPAVLQERGASTFTQPSCQRVRPASRSFVGEGMAPQDLNSKFASVKIKKNPFLERKRHTEKHSAFLKITFSHISLCAYVILFHIWKILCFQGDSCMNSFAEMHRTQLLMQAFSHTRGTLLDIPTRHRNC